MIKIRKILINEFLISPIKAYHIETNTTVDVSHAYSTIDGIQLGYNINEKYSTASLSEFEFYSIDLDKINKLIKRSSK